MAGTVRENILLRRAFYLPIPSGGAVGTYTHQSAGNNLGKIVAAVTLAPQEEGAALAGEAAASVAELGRKLGMQVVATTPRFLSRDDVTPEAIKEEEDILREQALKSGMDMGCDMRTGVVFHWVLQCNDPGMDVHPFGPSEQASRPRLWTK